MHDKLIIQKVIHDTDGNIIAYELNSGSIIDNAQAVLMAEIGELADVEVKKSQNGGKYIEGTAANLENLPELD